VHDIFADFPPRRTIHPRLSCRSDAEWRERVLDDGPMGLLASVAMSADSQVSTVDAVLTDQESHREVDRGCRPGEHPDAVESRAGFGKTTLLRGTHASTT
jgi:hypothetical protein